MRYHCVGVGRAINGRLISYTILDEEFRKVMSFSKDKLLFLMQRNEIANIAEENNKIIFTNGSADRFGGSNCKQETFKSIVVLRKLVHENGSIVYKVFNFDKGIFEIEEAVALKYAQEFGIVNGKLVNNGNKSYIASISGEYTTEEIKAQTMNLTDKVTLDFFLKYLRYKGCVASIGKEKIAVDSQKRVIELQNLTLPGFRSVTKIEFLKPLLVDNLTVNDSFVQLILGEGSHIENLRLSGDGDLITNVEISGASVKRCGTFDYVSRVSNVKVVGELREFYGGENLTRIDYSFNDIEGMEILDFRKCKDVASVWNSFRCLSEEKPTKVWMGTVKSTDEIGKNGLSELMSPFDKGITIIGGFNKLVNMDVLDLSGYTKLRRLKGFKEAMIKEVKLPCPNKYTIDVDRDFLMSAQLEDVQIPHDFSLNESFTYDIENGAFGNAKVIKANYPILISGDNHRKGRKILIQSVEGKGFMPRIRLSGEYEIEFEEGVERIVGDSSYSSTFRSLKFPSTLKEIGDEVFANSYIHKLEFSGTKLKRIGHEAFKDCTIKQKVVVLPETVKELGNKAFDTINIESLYIPEGVEKVGKSVFKGKLIYLHKGSLADRSLRGVYAKEYVTSVEEMKANIESVMSTERDIAKIKMAYDNKPGYEWIKEARYAKGVKLLLEIDGVLKAQEVVNREIPLDKSKYIDFPLSGLGAVGEYINQQAHSIFASSAKHKELTDRFKILSNMITNSTDLYVGQFTSKALKMYGNTIEDIKSYMKGEEAEVIYTDNLSSITLFPIVVDREQQIVPKFLVIVIVIAGRVVYTTVVDTKTNRLRNDTLYSIERNFGEGSRLEDYIAKGDNLTKIRDNNITLSNQTLPRVMDNKAANYFGDGCLFKTNGAKSMMFSMNTGRVYKLNKTINGNLVYDMVEPNKHKYKINEILNISQDASISYFNIVNGIESGSDEPFKPEKYKVVKILEDLRAEGLINNRKESTERFLNETGAIRAKVRLPRTYSSKNVGEYVQTDVTNQATKKRMGIDTLDGRVFAIYLEENGNYYGESSSVWLSTLNVERYVIDHNMYIVDSSVPKPMFNKQIKIRDFRSMFMMKIELGNATIGIAKHDGFGYLLIKSKRISGTVAEYSYIIAGLISNVDEAIECGNWGNEIFQLETYTNAQSKVEICRGFHLAKDARNGVIKSGLHPEYTIGTHKIFKLLGL